VPLAIDLYVLDTVTETELALDGAVCVVDPCIHLMGSVFETLTAGSDHEKLVTG
jgi:hypothetical protein